MSIALRGNAIGFGSYRKGRGIMATISVPSPGFLPRIGAGDDDDERT